MSTTIHFSSGKEQTISAGKLEKFIMDLKGRGIKLMIDRSDERTLIIPLNSNTLEYIIDVYEAPVISAGVSGRVSAESARVQDELVMLKEEIKDAAKEIEDKKDIEEKRDDAMQEIMDKSNCTHPKDKLVYYRQDTSKGSRYFPLCSFCGKRERYVKAESLSDEVKAAAPIWEG